MKNKKRKYIFLTVICILILWIVAGVTDFTLVHNYYKPIFCIGVNPADDGGSGHYMGLGYSFDIEGDFMPESTKPGITSYRGYLLGQEISRGFKEEMLGGTDPSSGKNANDSSKITDILKKPPTLTVICGENSTQALLGTYSWHHSNWDGTFTGIESDSMHPLQAKQYMQPLNMIPSYLSHIDPLQAYLQFDVAPDSVEICCWSEEYWDRPDDVSSAETPAVTKTDAGSSQDIYSTAYSFRLKEENYIYMITAKWNRSESYGGTAYYSFYTTYPLLEPQLIAP